MEQNTSVLQNWIVKMPIRMQSTLVLGLRGPDIVNMKETKLIIRWLRGLTFKPGNPENVDVFMASAPGRIVDRGPCSKELEMCAMHFYGHLQPDTFEEAMALVKGE